MTGRGGSSGKSGNLCGPRPKSPKGSGDAIEILDFFYLADMQFFGTDTPTRTPLACTHAPKKRNSSFTWRLCSFFSGTAVSHGGYALF